ncbi:MAG: phage integrase N-terminal SAM-like domain-containing protein [Candidatus Thiodiazotropha endolucinida]
MDVVKKPMLLEIVWQRMRLLHYSIRTEKSYIHWIQRFVRFHNRRHPKALGKQEIEAFLTHLAVDRKVSASTQYQAFNAFLLYGSGLRLIVCLRLRVQDIDFILAQIMVRGGKGNKDRYTILPASVTDQLQDHLEKLRTFHSQDLEKGLGRVYLPVALDRKYPSSEPLLIRMTNNRPATR